MISKKVLSYLDSQKIPYRVMDHKKVYTAYDAAQTLKVKLSDLVKSLMVRVDKDYYLVAVPSHKNVDFGLLKKALKKVGAKVTRLDLVKEKNLTKVFKLKPGGLTSFAALHKVQAVIDKDLQKAKQIVVSGGSLTQSLQLKAKDFLSLNKPLVALVGKPRKLPIAPKKSPAKKRARR